MINIGKQKFLNEGFDRNGNSRIAMWSNPVPMYQRKDGSYFIISQGRRVTITKQPDGTFYLATRPQ